MVVRRFLPIALFVFLTAMYPYKGGGPVSTAPSVSITGITLGGTNSFTPSAPAGTVIGTIAVTLSSGSFSGSLSLVGTDAASFAVSGSNLVTVGTLCGSPPCTYSLSIRATQGGATNSPLDKPEIITSTAGTASVNPCQGTTGTSASPNGTCLAMESQVNGGNNQIVAADGGVWSFAPFLVPSGDGYRVLRNGVLQGNVDTKGYILSICTFAAADGHICIADGGGAWYYLHDDNGGYDNMSGPHMTGNNFNQSFQAIPQNTGSASPSDLGVGPFVNGTGTPVAVLTNAPAHGTLYKSDGVTTINSFPFTITGAELNGLKYKPNVGATGAEVIWLTLQDATNHIKFTSAISFTIVPVDPVANTVTKIVTQGQSGQTIGIGTPTDANYSAGSLTVKATSLPTNGTVYKSDGTTPVALDTNYTTTELTGFKFTPSNVDFNSVFQYSVTNPAGGYAYGVVPLRITQDQIQTTYGSLTVQGDSAATALGVAAATGSGTLTVTVRALPTNGVVKSAGTPVAVNDTLTNAANQALTFTATAGTYGQVSTYDYSVSNGTYTTTGKQEIFVGGNPTLLWADQAFTCAGCGTANSDPIRIFPTLPQPATSGDLVGVRIQNDGLARFAGTITNVSGTTAKLHVNQFFEGILAASQTVTSTTIGAFTVTLASKDSGPGGKGSVYSITCVSACQAIAADEYMVSHGTMAANYVTFGQPWIDAHVQPADVLVVKISGTKYYVQNDQKATHADGSVAHSILTFKLPTTIADGASIDALIQKCTSACPSAPGTAPPTAAQIVAGTWPGCGSQPVCSYDVNVAFTATLTGDFSESGQTGDSAKSCLGAANTAGTTRTWLTGGLVHEYHAVCTIDGGRMKMEYNIRAYADGQVQTDAIVDNTWFWCGASGASCTVTAYNSVAKIPTSYTATFTQDGAAFRLDTHALYKFWNHLVPTAGIIYPNVIYDVPYFMATGAVPFFDVSKGVYPDWNTGLYSIKTLVNTGDVPGGDGTGPLSSGYIATDGGVPGDRPDIGPIPNWSVQWLLSQDHTAHLTMMLTAEANQGQPSHFNDENTDSPFGAQVNGITYPRWHTSGPSSFTASIPQNGFPPSSTTFVGSIASDVLTVSSISVGRVTQQQFIRWSGQLVTESAKVLFQLTGTAGGVGTYRLSAVGSPSPGGGTTFNGGGPWDLGNENNQAHQPEVAFIQYLVSGQHSKYRLFMDQAVNMNVDGPPRDPSDAVGVVDTTGTYNFNAMQHRNVIQNRDMAWSQRGIAECARWAVDTDPLKAACVTSLQGGAIANYQEFVRNKITGPWRTFGGAWGLYFSNATVTIEDGYTAITYGNIWRAHVPKVSYFAKEIVRFHSQLWQRQMNGRNGFDPNKSAAYFFICCDTFANAVAPAGPLTSPPIDSWASLTRMATLPMWYSGESGISVMPTFSQLSSNDGLGGNGNIWIAGQAVQSEILGYEEPRLLNAFAYSWAQINYASGGAVGYPYVAENYRHFPFFGLMPKLPNGQYMTLGDNFSVDTSETGSVTLSAPSGKNGGAASVGLGNGTYTGGNGAGYTSLIATGKGSTNTITAGTSDLVAVSNCGASTFIDNTGTNVFSLGLTCYGFTLGIQTVQFGTSGAGTTKIYGFRHGTDKFKVKTSLGGTWPANATAVIAGCAVSGSDTVCSLGSGNKQVTFYDVTNLATGDVTTF